MSTKCFASSTLYALFLTIMAGTALIFSYLHFDHVIAKVIIIVALILISVALTLTVERGSFITIVINAILWGTALSFLFDHLGSPDLLQMVYVVLVMVAWFVLFCFLTNFSFTREKYASYMIFWGVVLVVANIVFAVHMKNVLGWTSLILLVPFITFFVSLPGEAEDFTEHSHHIAIYSTLPALIIVLILMFFRVPVGSFEIGDFIPEVDDDYVFTYSPKEEIEDSKKKEFEFVLVYQLDRFARNRYDSAQYKAKLKKNGVRVISARENITDDASGVLIEGVLESMAEYYSKELSQKVKRGVHESLLKGNFIGDTVIYGYKVENKKYVIDPIESEIVKQVFNDYYNGKKSKEIADELTNKGIKNKRGKNFTMNSIAKLLRNQKYMGIIENNGETYDNVVPAIIDSDTFMRCNQIMDEHKHKQRQCTNENPYILSGKLFCGHCFNLMTAETGTGSKGVIYHYYKCYTKKRNPKKCDKANIPQDELEDLVFSKTKEFVLQPEIIENIAKVVVEKFNSEISQSALLTNLENQLKDKEKAINAMLDAIEKGVVTKSTQERLLKLEDEKNELEDKVAIEKSHQIKPLNFNEVKSFLTMFAKKKYNNKTDRNEFFNIFINRVILYDDHITIIYNTSLDPKREIYFPRDKSDNDLSGGTIIYTNKDNETTEIQEKSRSNLKKFKRQIVGGKRGI